MDCRVGSTGQAKEGTWFCVSGRFSDLKHEIEPDKPGASVQPDTGNNTYGM